MNSIKYQSERMTCDNEIHIKKRVFEIISKADEGDTASKIFDGFIMALISLSVLSIILESFQDIASKYSSLFSAFETFSVTAFSIEYALRIWTANYLYPDSKHPNLKNIYTSIMAIIDLISIPSFLPSLYLCRYALFAYVPAFENSKFSGFSNWGAMSNATYNRTVISKSASQLITSIVICFFVMLFSSIIMYTVENPVQPEQFPDIISSLWWAICTLTTVGYGDVYPITAAGKFFAAIISLVGIGIIAIPTGIISAGFTSLIGKDREETDKKNSLPILRP